MRKLVENRGISGRGFRRLLRDDEAQAAVEYILMVSVLVSVGLFVGMSLRSTVFKLWRYFADHIAGPCPTGCKGGVK